MWARGIPGLVLCAVGAIFVGQGAGAIHGSSMTGHSQWIGIGAALLVIGLVLVGLAWRAPRGPSI
jgi:hypothetical protein